MIVVNSPCPLASAYVPSYKAYYHQPLPKTLRALVPGCTSFDVQRTDDKTLVIQSKAPDIFSCDDVGPVHVAYALQVLATCSWADPRCKKGDRYDLDGLTVEVLESDAVGFAFPRCFPVQHFAGFARFPLAPVRLADTFQRALQNSGHRTERHAIRPAKELIGLPGFNFGVRHPGCPYLSAAFMATIKPFAALRPKPELAARICELPYDVMSSDEARAIAAGNPLSFLHVSKPEIDLPPGTDVYAPEVYAKGRENFQKLIRDGALRQDAQPCFYLYRQIMGQHSQTGLVAAASCEEYLRGIIKKHELTRPDKEDDRVRHIEALNAQTGPVFLTYRAVARAGRIRREEDLRKAGRLISPPRTACGTRPGRLPTRTTSSSSKRSSRGFRRFTLPTAIIAARRRRGFIKSRKGAGHSGQFLAVIFPHNQMQILPYNRVLKDLNGWTPEQLLENLGTVFAIDPHGAAAPARKHELGLYLARQMAHAGRSARNSLATRRPDGIARRDAAAKTRARTGLRH